MQIKTVFTIGDRDINEDAMVVDPQQNIFAVIDGATGLGGLPGSLASGLIKKALEKEAFSPLRDKIIEGNTDLRETTESSNKEQHLLEQIPKHERSSCGLAAIQIHKNEDGTAASMDWASAGDCMLFLQFKDQSIRQVTFDHIDRLDNEAIMLMQKEWDNYLNGISTIEDVSIEELKRKHQLFRKNVQELLQANRNKLNTPEGYGIIDGSHEAADFLEYGHIPLIAVNKILLLSDGLKLHSRRGSDQEETWLTTAKMAFEKGLDELEKYILQLEESDPACLFYPRLKQHDDKSGILIEL